MLFAIPAVFMATIKVAESIAARSARLNTLLIAARALRATTVRSLALAATGAIAIFGSVIVEGSHQDLLHGLYRDYEQYVGTADVWVSNHNDHLATMDFPAHGLRGRMLLCRALRQSACTREDTWTSVAGASGSSPAPQQSET